MPVDLVSTILATLAEDAAIVALAGSDPAPVFGGVDPRRTTPVPYPYAVVVAVAGRSSAFTGRGDLLRDRYLDVHWLDEDHARADRLARRSAVALRAAAVAGDLDSDEGKVLSLLPGSERSHVDPRSAPGIGGAASVIDSMIQVRVVLAGSLS